jgi:CHAT domain-containing protein
MAWLVAARAAAVSELDLSEMWRLYFQGCGLSAVEQIERFLGSDSFAAQTADSRFALYRTLFEICTEVSDVSCVVTHYQDFAATARELGRDSPDAPLEWTLYYGSVLKLWGFDRVAPSGDDLLRLVANNAKPINWHLYIESQILLAGREILADEPASARDRAERALSLLLTLRKPPSYFTEKWLIDIAAVLADAGDLQRAKQIAISLDPFVHRSFAAGGYLRLRHALMQGLLAERLGDIGSAELAIAEAKELSGGLELSQATRQYYQDFANVELATVELAAGHPEKAEIALADYSRGPYLLSAPTAQFQSDRDLEFAAAVTLARAAQGRAVPDRWLEALGKAIAGSNAEGAVSAHDLDRQSLAVGASALFHITKHDPAALIELEGFIRRRLRLFELMSRRLPDVSVLPNARDRVFLRLALQLLRVGGAGDHRHLADLALQVGQIVNRTLRDADGDALALLANSVDEPSARSAHALLRLSERRISEEHDLLASLLDALLSGRDPPRDQRFPIYDYGERSRLAWMGEVQHSLLDYVFRKSGAHPVSQVPDLAALQAVLRADEELILFFPDWQSGIHVVVVRDNAWVRVTAIDWDRTVMQARLLLDGLWAQHPASDYLDRQYPVLQARELYDVLLRPVQDLASGRHHLIWVAPEELQALPITALLPEAPPVAGEGFDLSRARFVVRDFDVSVVTSVKEFIASRRLASRTSPISSFLGVGDPIIGPQGNKGSGDGQGSVRSVDLIQRLPMLPDAGRELGDISRLFGDKAVTLTQANATEAAARRHLLGNVSLIDIATHGLFKNEIAPRSDSALVLTPGRGTSDDDGLLTAAELADLELHARLAVLSSCNTASADTAVASRGVQGLTTALALAGVPASLATLWPVDSAISRRIVVNTIADIRRRGSGPAAALSAAIRQELASPISPAYLHPRFWAPFVIYGDGGESTTSLRRGGRWEQRRYSLEEEAEGGSMLSVTEAFGGAGLVISGVFGSGTTEIGAVELVCLDGSTRWKVRYPLWYPVRVAGSSAGVLAVGIEKSSAPSGERVVARRFSESGIEVWNVPIDTDGYETVVVSAVPDENRWQVILSQGARSASTSRHRRLLRIVIDDQGRLLHKADTDLGPGEGALACVALRHGSSTTVVFGGVTKEKGDYKRTNSYGEVEDCSFAYISYVGQINDADSVWHDASVLPADMLSDGTFDAIGGLVLAGSTYLPCMHYQTSHLQVSDGTLERWTEASSEEVLPSRLGRLLWRHSDGALIAVGTTARLAEPPKDFFDWNNRARATPGENPTLSMNGQEWDDVAVYQLSSDGHLMAMAWLEAGSSITVKDAALSEGDVLTVVGSVGGRAFVAQYDWVRSAPR